MDNGGSPLKKFRTYGWEMNDNLSEDENFMDLVLIITRSSRLKQGSMGCILVRPLLKEDGATLMDRIIGAENNQELYQEGSSDIHAEIAAIGSAARAGRSTEESTAYITMPPCKKCFGALVAAGVKRMVSIHPAPRSYLGVMQRVGVDMSSVEDISESRRRVEALISQHEDEMAAVVETEFREIE